MHTAHFVRVRPPEAHGGEASARRGQILARPSTTQEERQSLQRSRPIWIADSFAKHLSRKRLHRRAGRRKEVQEAKENGSNNARRNFRVTKNTPSRDPEAGRGPCCRGCARETARFPPAAAGCRDRAFADCRVACDRPPND